MEKQFVKNFLITLVVLITCISVFIFIVDPKNSLHLSPNLPREVNTHNQRASYPAVAKSKNFDSLIIGTSTTRMINPKSINTPLNASFANLSINSGTWWEQSRIFQLFVKHHPAPKRIIWGIDVIWCPTDKQGDKLTKRYFPDWLYDENPWNDYAYLLNFKMIEQSFEQLGAMTGFTEPRYDKNGFKSLNKKGTPFSLKKARLKIYKQIRPKPVRPAIAVSARLKKLRQTWAFPNVKTLSEQIAQLPRSTEILLIFVPYHRYNQGRPGSRLHVKYNECKQRFSRLKRKFPNVKIIDFMYRSDFTMNDALYWDKIHFNEEGAKILQKALIDFWKYNRVTPTIYREIK